MAVLGRHAHPFIEQISIRARGIDDRAGCQGKHPVGHPVP